MKLFGYSEIPNVTQYLHLGYLSAASLPKPEGRHPGLVRVGLLSCIIGIAVALIAWQRSKTIFIFGLVISAIGILVMVFAPPVMLEQGEFKYLHPVEMTRISIVVPMTYQIKKHMTAGEIIPTDVRVMQRKWRLKDRDIQDAWFHDLRIEKNDKGGYTVTSSAKDGIFGTKDDIKIET
ncbi:MAG: hypothetical protein ACYC0V_07650 [Armatimonadota bacterium]